MSNENLTDAQKLRMLADWFDLKDSQNQSMTENIDEEVQRDLRRIADDMDQACNISDSVPLIQGDHATNLDAVAQNDYMSPSGAMYPVGKYLMEAADFIRKSNFLKHNGLVLRVEYPDETSRRIVLRSQVPNRDLVVEEYATEIYNCSCWHGPTESQQNGSTESESERKDK